MRNALLFVLLTPLLAAAEPPAIVPSAGASVRLRPAQAQPHASFKVAIPTNGGSAEIQDLSPTYSPYQSTATASTSSTSEYSPYVSDTSTPSSALSDAQILAMIDNTPITDQDVLRELWNRRGKETLEWMIGKAILQRELDRLNLSVSNREVDERLQEHLASLAKAFPNTSEADDLTRFSTGMRVDEYRERTVWVELALRKIMHSALAPSDDQLRGYYAERQADFIQPERVRISQIFIAPQGDPDNDNIPGPAEWAAAEKQILEAHARLRIGRNGDDFAAVASAYGAGAAPPRWVGRGELLRELEEAAFSLQPGSFSAPLKSAMGYHIIRTEEKRERNLPRFDEVREQVREQFEEKRFVLLAGEFMQRLRERAQAGGGLVISEIPDLFPEQTPDQAGLIP